MAIWKEPTTTKKDTATMTPEPAVQREAEYPADIVPPTSSTTTTPVSSSPSAATTRRTAPRDAKESVIASDITITGKIDGAGHVRIAGKFDGDVHIQGDLTIEAGAKLTGSVRANSVTIGGEIEGNIESASSVEILSTGVLNGDLKAGMLTVAAGSRMRGKVEFGWGDEPSSKSSHSGIRQVS